MATLRNKRKLAAVSRETPQSTSNNQSQHTFNPGMTEEYTAQVSQKNERRVNKKLSQELSRKHSSILDDLSQFDDFVPNPQVRNCSVAVPGTSRNSGSENREPTGDQFLGDTCNKAVFSTYHSVNPKHPEQE